VGIHALSAPSPLEPYAQTIGAVLDRIVCLTRIAPAGLLRNAPALRRIDGAFGLASALIYPPGSYASTEELIEEARATAPCGGVYITHMRSEGDRFVEAVDEALRIGHEAGVPVEIYHLKAAGVKNWPKLHTVIAKIDSARAHQGGDAGRACQLRKPLPRRDATGCGGRRLQRRFTEEVRRQAPARNCAGVERGLD
jgi:sugar/nucleoside kinase (ribokinase family)